MHNPFATDTTVEARPPGLKQERARRTYGQILDAGAAVFALKGFGGVTVMDIAARAGVTKGALYFHFTDKEAIAVAVSREYYARMGKLSDEVRSAGKTPLETAAELLRRMAYAIRSDAVFQAALRLHIEHFTIDAELPTPFVAYVGLLTDLLEQAEAAGDLPTAVHPEPLARVLVAAFFGAQHVSWVLRGRADLVERIEEVIDLLHMTVARH